MQHPVHGVDHDRGEAERRLVEQEHPGRTHEGPTDLGDHLLLAAGQGPTGPTGQSDERWEEVVDVVDRESEEPGQPGALVATWRFSFTV